MRGPDLVELPDRSGPAVSTLTRALGRHLARLGCRVSRIGHQRYVPGDWPPAPIPRCEISGLTATFEELERVTLAAGFIARVEAPPRGTLRLPVRPEPELPRTLKDLGWVRRERPARIYDVVPFAFELDLLELRLAELHDVVDHFVVAEAARGFGGVRKPQYLQRNWARFAPFHQQMTALAVDTSDVDQWYPTARRDHTDWTGEDAVRTRLWQHVRPLALDPDAVVIWSDVDELAPRWLMHLLRHYECPMPMRVRASAFRYHFGWRDPEAEAGITIVDARSVPAIDARPEAIRALPARLFAASGAAHLTSFLDPAVLLMKCILTTEWVPDVLPYLRNANGEIVAMIEEGTWFGRPLPPYDAESDPLGLIPPTARINRDRFARFWPTR